MKKPAKATNQVAGLFTNREMNMAQPQEEHNPVSADALIGDDILISQTNPRSGQMVAMLISASQVSRLIDELLIAFEEIKEREAA